MNKKSNEPTLKRAGAESMSAKRSVRMPLRMRAIRSVLTTLIMRSIGNHGDETATGPELFSLVHSIVV